MFPVNVAMAYMNDELFSYTVKGNMIEDSSNMIPKNVTHRIMYDIIVNIN